METYKSTSLNKRFFYIDNLRVFLTLLVIFHHVAITYGADGGWYYYEHTNNNIVNSILSNFTGFNQMFFMSLFFFISGYFTPGAYDRKGTRKFLTDRLLRLGIPLVIFFFTLSPIVEYIKDITYKHLNETFWEFYKYNIIIKHNLCPGPLWFVETLLVFSAFYALWRVIQRYLPKSLKSKTELLTNKKVILFIVFLSVFTYMGRILFPAGHEHFHLQLGYFPNYISLYIAGVLSYKKNWLNELPKKLGLFWSLFTFPVVVIVGLVIEPILFGMFHTVGNQISGGGYWQSLFHSCFETFGCVGICITFLYLFKEKVNTQKSRISKLLAANAYTIYIIHAPIIVLLALSMKGIILFPLIKFIIVSVIGTLLCFLISQFFFKKIPYSDRVL